MIRRLIASRLRRGSAWVSGLVALPLSVLPFWLYAQYNGTGKLLALQIERRFRDPGVPSLPPAEAARYRAETLQYRDGLVVLLYHGVLGGASAVGDNPEETTVDTGRFARHMRMLVEAGFHTVSAEHVAEWIHGRAGLPDNAVLITFDDGREDAMLNAPPILKKLGLRASVFIISGAASRSPVYYASSSELRDLADDGWSIGAHAADGHQAVQTGDGRRLPAMSARRWLGDRSETLEEFRVRVRAELEAARDAARDVSGRVPVAYAWPFGAYGADSRTNDPRIREVDLAEARAVFPLVFTDDDQESAPMITRATDPAAVPRLRVDPRWSAEDLWRRIQLTVAATAPEVSRAS